MGAVLGVATVVAWVALVLALFAVPKARAGSHSDEGSG